MIESDGGRQIKTVNISEISPGQTSAVKSLYDDACWVMGLV